MKKLLSLVLVAVMAVACFGFASAEDAKIKLGVILLHDEDSTYDNNFINAAKAVEEALGIELVLRRNVDESNACYEVACELADEGCNIVFADSFGHETYMIEAAKEYPEVEFCHATGTMAHTEKLDNFHNAFASIYEGRFLAGIAAGMKLNEIKAAGQLKGEVPMIGYVGAF
ncbi:MAG: BMP family ABC transporter substrate-binding protein, partial [Clostridia bacterium]|nr:BMP family ABC transporter substrate-binding protein [Clostridia bacterium]